MRHVSAAQTRRQIDHRSAQFESPSAGEEHRQHHAEGDRREGQQRAAAVAPEVAPRHREELDTSQESDSPEPFRPTIHTAPPAPLSAVQRWRIASTGRSSAAFERGVERPPAATMTAEHVRSGRREDSRRCTVARQIGSHRDAEDRGAGRAVPRSMPTRERYQDARGWRGSTPHPDGNPRSGSRSRAAPNASSAEGPDARGPSSTPSSRMRSKTAISMALRIRIAMAR